MAADRRYLHAGETALVVEFGPTADPAFHQSVLALDRAIGASSIEGVVETVPTYRSLMVHFDHRRTDAATLRAAIDGLALDGATMAPNAQTWRIPACYDGSHGEDLSELAALVGSTPDRVATLHATARYTIVMYGFAPGFVFLDGLPPELAVSRRQTPRPPAQPGALTVANGQALIASLAMPTGWYVLGRTPVRTFDRSRDPMFPFAVGDIVTFERIDPDRFAALQGDNGAGPALHPV